MIPSASHPTGPQEQKSRHAGERRLRWPALAASVPHGGGEAATRPGSASMSQHARAGQVATDMPVGSGHSRTFLSTFCLSGISCPHLQSHRWMAGTMRGALVLLSPEAL